MSNDATKSQETVEKTEKKSKVLNAIVNTVVILVLVFGIIVGFSAFITKKGNGVPNFLGYSPISILSDSMKPFFEKGDLIVDKRVTDVTKLEVGDVITFWTVINGERVLNSHRIVDITDYDTYLSFTTKGDANTIEDALTVHQNEIVGRYLFRIRKIGSFFEFAQTSTGFLLIIVVPFALFFLWQLVAFFKTLFAYQAEKNRLKFEAEMEQRMLAMGMVPQRMQQAQVGEAAPEVKAEEDKAVEPEAPKNDETKAPDVKVVEPEAPKPEEAPAEAASAEEPAVPAAEDTQN